MHTKEAMDNIEQDKPEPFALDLNDDTPLPVICELGEDGTCEACQ